MTGMGHQDAFPRPRANGRCRFSKGTLAGTRGNSRDAPRTVVPLGGVLSVGPHLSLVSGATLGTPALRYEHLHAPRLVSPETFERIWLTRALQTSTAKSVFLRQLPSDPWFEDANLRALIGRTCPRPDQAFLKRLIDYGIATGYLRGRTVQRTSG